MKLLLPANEVLGGLVSAAVAIPLAMGYGMFAFAPLGEDYFEDGALAGIATAVVVAIACVALGDKTTTVYAPRITSTFFLGLLIFGLAHSDEPAIRAGGAPLVLAIAFSIVLLAGAFESLFGVIKLGTLIKFTPQPVMAGFQNAAAALLFLVQLGNVCGFDRTVPFTQVPQHLDSIKPLSLAVAAITFTVMWNAKKLLPKVPPMLVGIGLGCILYYVGVLAGLGSYLGPIIASGPRAAIGPTAFPYFGGLARDNDLIALLPTILGGALALAIIASIDALLCAKLVTAPGEPRRDGDRLLMRLGVGNLAAASIGGITSGINIGPSIVNRAFGARTPLSVLVNAVALLVAGTLLFSLLGQIPRVALSAVIMVIAVQHFDVWSLRLVRAFRRGPHAYRFNVALDLAVVVAVAVLSIAINIVPAVFIGVAIAVALFVFRMSRSIIRRSYRCGTIHSRTSRTAPDRAFLEGSGDAILVMELQGALFFGTGEKMLSEIETALRRETSCVILDLRRLTEVDSTGANVLLELKANLAQRNIELLLAAAAKTIAMERLESFGVLSSIGDANIVPDVDRGIQRAEDDLLRTQPQLHDTEMPLAQVGVLAGFSATDLKVIEPYLKRASYPAGAVVFRENEVGNEVLMVIRGTASAYLQTPNTNIRLATFAPGTIFGELAILDEGVRSATVIADKELACRALTTSDFAALSATSPSVAIRLLAAIARELSGRLRTANRTIHQLDT
jgi:MFS superfamily sulfate permease-like transporter/CRP-like cAMP-binding protein